MPVVDLDVLKKQCRVDPEITDEDDLIDGYHDSAVEWIEDYTGRSLTTQTREGSQCAFAYRWWLEGAVPLQSVTFIKYYDASNVLQTLSASVYSVPAFTEPAYVRLAYGQTWPVTYDRDDAVQIEYVTGATSAEAVPAPLRQAVQLLVGHQFANREAVVVGTIASELPLAVTSLCAPYRLDKLRRPDWEAA